METLSAWVSLVRHRCGSGAPVDPLLTLLVAALCDVEVCAQSLADDFACGFVVVCCAPFGCCTQFRVEADCQDFRWA